MATAKSQKLTAKNLIAPCLSALMFALAFSRGNLGILAWFCLVPLFLELNNKTRLQRWLLFLLFAILFFLGTLYWLVHVSLVGLLCLCVFLGLEFSLFALLMPAPGDKHSLLLIPLLWIIFERLRGFLFFGFGWGLIGYTQFRNLALIQSAQLFGVWGISFLIVLINVGLTHAVNSKFRVSLKKSFIFIPAMCLILVYMFGYYSLRRVFPSPEITISLIQANIPQEQKWDSKYSEAIIKKFSILSKKAMADKPELIVWPETSVPGYLLDETKFYLKITNLARELKASLLVGSPREDYTYKKYYNTAFLFSPDGHLQCFHDKLHLVPFGEYIPHKNLFSFLENTQIADFSAGERYTIFEVTGHQGKKARFGVLICFEDVFPCLVRNFRGKGADFLVTITNEAWFKNSSEPIQHTAISVFRAIENRCWFLRCANTGISCFIDPHGRIRKKIEQGGDDIFVQGIAAMNLSD
ncbi:MAG: apolipoprotein N-acyltransferase [Candidatus Omnitrophica bacterium]|nr:apolipoprotein N-acyltransferase [Candidatus Omnitrophota bacterium]